MITLGNRPISKVYQGSTLYQRIYLGTNMIHPGVITFEDANVKSICVSNWGGGIVSGEITTTEAAAVTSLNGKFYGNTTITKFNELRYFIGLTSLYHQNVNSYAAGEFYNCTALTEVTMPAAAIDTQSGAFRGCSSLVSVDMTPLTATKLQLAGVFRGCSALTSVRLKGGVYQSSSGGTVAATYCFYNDQKLRTIIIDGTADWSKFTNMNQSFYRCYLLADITGTITGLGTNFSSGTGLSLANCYSLTRDSLMVIINGLASVTGTHALTLHADAYARLTQADIDIAEAKGWTVGT